MKKRLLAALAATALLAGCSVAAAPATTATESLTTSSTPVPEALPGAKVRSIASSEITECGTTIEESDLLSSIDYCDNDFTLIEFKPDVDQNKAVQEGFKTLASFENYDPWLVGDGWMLQGPQAGVEALKAVNNGTRIKLAPGTPLDPEVRLEKMMAAVEKVTGTKCTDENDFGFRAVVSGGCKLANGDYYTIMGVFKTEHDLSAMLSEAHKPFTAADHDVFSVRGKYWFINDVKQSEAKKLAKILDGEEWNLNYNSR